MVKSRVTPSTIALSSKKLDFGTVYVNQESTTTVTLTNTSLLPQKIAFVKLKKEVTVSPNDGFAVLLPNESMDFEVKFCPLLPQEYQFNVVLMSSVNDTYNIKIVGKAVDAPVAIDNTSIVMRTTAPG